MHQNEDFYVKQTAHWIRSFIIKYNFCPFAKREMDKGAVRIQSSQNSDKASALAELKCELEFLTANPETETSFLVFPLFLGDFFDYLDFIDEAEQFLEELGYEGVYQLASFHPHYCFADADFDDVTNYTNRSPYPMLHILRERSVEKAIAFYGDTSLIPEINKARLEEMGLENVVHILGAT